MVMDEIIRKVTEGHENVLQKMLLYADKTVIWELKESTLQKKLQLVVIMSKDFGLNRASI
jgi:hypothetical protein